MALVHHRRVATPCVGRQQRQQHCVPCRARAHFVRVTALKSPFAPHGDAAASTSPELRPQLSGFLPGIAKLFSIRSPVRTFSSQEPLTGSGDGGKGGSSGSGGGGGGNGDGGDGENDPIYNLEQVEALAKERQVSLPSDMLKVAAQYGLRASALTAYFSLQSMPVTGWIVRMVPALRDRLIADKLFLFKVFAEVAIDSGCTTVAEVRKRGDKFWSELEFYLSDLSVGLTLDVVLVSLMAPVAVIGGASKAAMATGVQKLLSNVPSAVFAASLPGVVPYTLGQRLACIAVKFGEYSLAGMVCGLVGQGVCNALMNWRRSTVGAKEDDVPVPPLLMTSLVWGLFMGVSSNLRYQAVFGIERLVDMTIARRVPQVAYGTTVAVRFINNVAGGENFIDIARWAGCQ